MLIKPVSIYEGNSYRELCDEGDKGLPHPPGVRALLDAATERLLRVRRLRRGKHCGRVDHGGADVLVEQAQSTGIGLMRIQAVAVVFELKGLEELRQDDERIVRSLVLALQFGVGKGLQVLHILNVKKDAQSLTTEF